MYAPVIEMHRALMAHDLDVVGAAEGPHDQEVVDIVDYSFDLEQSQSSQTKATGAPELASILRPQLGLALEGPVAFAAVNDLKVGCLFVSQGHKASVEAVGVSLVAILLPFSLLLSSRSLQLLLWMVPIAVDSSRQLQYVETRSRSHFINI